mgnify:CR=1 FL=1
MIRHRQLSLAERLKRDSHRICALILYSDLPWIDISIQIDRMRQCVLEESPEQIDLFEALYESRFERLRRQWRDESDQPL